MINKEAINKARAVYYGLFASLFTFLDNPNDLSLIVKTVDILRQNPLDEHSQKALTNMKIMLEEGGYTLLKAESDEIFYSPYSAFIPITASFYDEQRDDGKKRLEMVNYVLSSKFRRDNEKCKELEDNIGFVILFMQKLTEDSLKGDKGSDVIAKEVFTDILNGFIDEFIFNLYEHEDSHFYKEVAIVLKAFTEVERLFFNVVKPQKEVQRKIVALEQRARKAPKERPKRERDDLAEK